MRLSGERLKGCASGWSKGQADDWSWLELAAGRVNGRAECQAGWQADCGAHICVVGRRAGGRFAGGLPVERLTRRRADGQFGGRSGGRVCGWAGERAEGGRAGKWAGGRISRD